MSTTRPPSSNMTPLEAAAAEWVRGRAARGELAANSAEVELTRLRSLAAVAGPLDVASLDRAVLLRWQRSIGGRAAGTRRQYLTTVSRFCRWLVEEGRLEADPSVGLVKVREPRRVPRALSATEVALVLEACGDDARALAVVWLMVGCGLRCVEVSNLDLADYNADPGREAVVVKGKAGHERTLPVDAPVRRALQSYLAGRGQAAGPLIRPDRRGKWSSDGRVSAHRISEMVSALMVAAGVHQPGDGRTAHALRHTAASDVLDASRDLRLVSQMLGHQSLATTQVYLRRASLDQLRTAMGGRDYGTAPDEPVDKLLVPPPPPTGDPATYHLHCPTCSWVTAAVADLHVAPEVGTDEQRWRYETTCPQCGQDIRGSLDADHDYGTASAEPADKGRRPRRRQRDKWTPTPGADISPKLFAPPPPPTGDPATYHLHCPTCSWVTAAVADLHVAPEVGTDEQRWRYETTCPQCGQDIRGTLDPDRGLDYLTRGAR